MDIAKVLFHSYAVNVNIEKPYIFTSGVVSPIYVDCRKLISSSMRIYVLDWLSNLILSTLDLEEIDFIAGGESAGIPYAAFMAMKFNKPMVYVRKAPKGHGLGNQIEGIIGEKARGILMEDQATTGASKINFINAIRKQKAYCDHTFVIFKYDIFKDTLKEHDINIYSLCTARDLFSYACEHNLYSNRILKHLEYFLQYPYEYGVRPSIGDESQN